MSDFRFDNPNWSYALWLAAAFVALLTWLNQRRGTVLTEFLSSAMQSRLVYRLPPVRHWLRIACLGLAAVSLIVALMRPQWGLTYQEMPRVGAQIMVCLDVSKSMLAEDTAPNRLERAKAEVSDLLSYLEGDQVGLIAFAGRATVLCPITPDFGFFKLILESAGPQSVGRGGTRLEEPIRKALDGFRTESDVSRVILLITDGEDHDSHPLDASKAAAERGVKILTVGFGDEAGSEIHVTNPETGARTMVRDADGNPVVTHLDGETLREIALATDGAYIPAGTGALDLKSIYDAHISPLVRGQLDDRGRAIRREGFQWAVLCGILFLVAAVVIGSGSVKSELRDSMAPSRKSRRLQSTATALLMAILIAVPSQAQQDESTRESNQSKAKEEQAADANLTDPRDMYNQSLAFLNNDLDRAEQLLTDARRESKTDGDVRFRATYNMGWVEVRRADKLLSEQPEEALAHLRRAADWFRDAVQLRPENQDARYNLEIILRRILELSDSFAKTDDRDLTQRLDELIKTQRELVGASRQLVDRVSTAEDPNAVDQFRPDFRKLAVEQRKTLSESQAISVDAREELDKIEGKKQEELTPQEKLRAAQLSNLLYYNSRANQRLGQARGQMRRRQAERSFRRAAAGLDELKRARDQLRNPVEILDVILADAVSLAQLTAAKASEGNAAVAAAADLPELPAWLTRDYLSESQTSMTERTTELVARLQAGLEEQKPTRVGPPTEEEQHQRAHDDRFLNMVRQATPFLAEGKDAFDSATQALSVDELDKASQQQLRAIIALREARERFLEIRGLVELAYSDETQVDSLLAAPGQDDDRELTTEQRFAAVRAARQVQKKNLERSERIAKFIEEDLAVLPPTADQNAQSSSSDPAAEQTQAQRQQLELAKQLLPLAQESMSKADQSLADAIEAIEKAAAEKPDNEPKTIDEELLQPSRDHVAKAVEYLQALRRLFFSIVEHLRETAQRQAQLNDKTEQVAGLEQDEEMQKNIGPITLRQKELHEITKQISQALDEQAKQQPSDMQAGQNLDPKQLEQIKQLAEQYAKAAELVSQGSDEMQQAAESLTADPAKLDEARKSQDDALGKLAEALLLLQPPQQNQQNQQQQDEGNQSEEGEQQQPKEDQNEADPSRLLQAIRDRDAQRRRDRDRRQHAEHEPVEKDW